MTPGQRRLKRWREDPITFVREVFGAEPDVWQAEGLTAFGNPEIQRISFQACAGPGKSALLAWCGWHFLVCQGERGDHPKGAGVSVTGDNLADNLWPEFSKWQSRSELLKRAFTWTKSRIFLNDHPETWFLSARSYSKTANSEEQGRTLSGLHGGYVLALIDESGEIPPAVLKAAEQALSTRPRFGKILQAGNPTSHEGMLYAAATMLRHLWHIIRITGDPDDPRRSPRIDVEWAREQIRTYGRTNPWVMALILGEFPPSSTNALLGPDEVEQAMRRTYQSPEFDQVQKRLGVDVARFGDDRTVIFPRQGLVAYQPTIMRGARTNEIAARVASMKLEWGSELEFVDDTGGWGAGVIDSLLLTGQSPLPVNFAGNPLDRRYANARAEMWFKMAEWVKRGGALPNLPELGRELTAPTYDFQNGRFTLEPKDMIKKRLGYSPDLADALALTFALPEMPASFRIPGAKERGHKVLHDWDPLEERGQ